jgi:hypothetical protein
MTPDVGVDDRRTQVSPLFGMASQVALFFHGRATRKQGGTSRSDTSSSRFLISHTVF